ncbi:MAG: hypothetical protein JW745_02840 [Sedimentisphaerales bacterium]|nr:hypothetical protein [Sedimentisphaerales bacterium]MBN2841994.1 hypothetical protein [Sedimentisphaerales bacterium]
MNRRFTKLAIMALAAWAISSTLYTNVCQAAPSSSEVSAIPEEKLPSVAGAWFMGIILSVGGIVVGIKNSKRTHQD